MDGSNEARIKAQLSNLFAEALEARQWTGAQAAKALGIPAPKVYYFLSNKTEGEMSLTRMLTLLDRLGVEVHIES